MSKKEQEEKETVEKEETISVSELAQENLQAALKEASEFKDKYFRALAEMENTRKRLQQEKQEMISYAVGNMLAEFLIPLDNLEIALKYTDNLSDELKNWAQGFKMIASQFTQVLENHGIVPFETVGKKFDPHFHEAVETVVSDKEPEGTILSEIHRGYRHGDRVLRVAKVKVSAKASHKDEAEKELKQKRGEDHDKKEK